MSIPPNKVSFFRYLVNPRGESATLIVVFVISFIFGISLLSTGLSQLSDFSTTKLVAGTCTEHSLLDVLSLLFRILGFVFCVLIDFFLFGEIYKNYKQETN